ncbi:MAG: hypothetical protein AVDCRST_MAG96-2955 [uncultured Segetibacter sp.]|uniref:Uncharacterized protein n=1 Tax=uncultured Segetibacter sp. TaxID=481133 RepID=A0A6J4TEF4_9BACT|nr:MAG: hypothetical protein AVDCRST_MAG96-2955 [uncultured Segetibacter sp.]
MIKNLADLLMRLIRNLSAAEDHMFNALPAIIEKAQHTSLKNALNHHRNLTAEQKKRLEQIAQMLLPKETEELLQFNPDSICEGMMGLIKETNDILESGLAKEVTDAAIIAYVQKMEHYEISTYGTALAYARQLRMVKAEALINETLNEEYEADDLLTALATASFNKESVPQYIEPTPDADAVMDSEDDQSENTAQVQITERTINSPGGRAGTSHRRYGSGESRGH